MSTHRRSHRLISVTDESRTLDYFTDRHDFCDWYMRALNDDPAPSTILCLHGDGGNGKSALLDFLAIRLSRRAGSDEWAYLRGLEDVDDRIDQMASAVHMTSVPVARLNFQSDRYSAFEALSRLRAGLPDVRMPLFDLAVVTYLRKSGLDSDERLEGNFPGNALKFAFAALAFATANPVVGLMAAFTELGEGQFGTWFREYKLRRNLDEADIAAIRRMDPERELIPELPYLFANDLNAAVADPETAGRVVLMFDTHEALWSGMADDRGALYWERDAWLRHLLGALDREAGVVAIVAGRDAPRWINAPGRDRLQEADLDIRLVEDFTFDDGDEYLELAGIDDSNLRSRLLEEARVGPERVHPFHLGLGIDLVRAALERGDDPLQAVSGSSDEWQDQRRALLDRFMKYIDDSFRNAIAAISVCRWFDEEIFAYLGNSLDGERKYPTDDGNSLRRLRSLSFVRPFGTDVERKGQYRVHDLIRRFIHEDEYFGVAGARMVHSAMETYWRERIDPHDIGATVEAIYHANRVEPERGVLEWIAEFNQALWTSRYSDCRALLELLDALLVNDPELVGRIAHRVGDFYAELSEYREARASWDAAVAAYERSVTAAPDHVLAHRNLGDVLQVRAFFEAGLGEHESARASYSSALAACDRALKLAPQDAEAYSRRALTLRGRGGVEAAMGEPEAARASFNLARAAFDQALELAPGDVGAHNNRGNLLKAMGQLEVALGEYEAARASYSAALAACDRALQLEPKDVWSHNNRGRILTVLGQLDAMLGGFDAARVNYALALTAYDRALALAPDNPHIHSNQGDVLVAVGHLDEQEEALVSYRLALTAYDRALALAPDNPHIHKNRGDVFLAFGLLEVQSEAQNAARISYSQAVIAYDRALVLAPNRPDFLRSRECIHALINDIEGK